MKLWITLLFLLVAACAAAFGWQALAADPGYVLVKLGQTSIETTLVFALARIAARMGSAQSVVAGSALAARGLVATFAATWPRTHRRRPGRVGGRPL